MITLTLAFLAAHPPARQVFPLGSKETAAYEDLLKDRDPGWDQAFNFDIGGGTLLSFVPVKSKERPETRCAYALVESPTKIAAELESTTPSSWACDEIDAVGFPDLDGDGKLDIVVVREFMTGIGPTGAQPFTVAEAWINKGGGKFAADEKLNESLEKKKAKTIGDVKKLAKARFGK